MSSSTLPTRGRARPLSSLLASLVLLAPIAVGCSEGGEEDRPVSEVTITASHHLWALLGNRAFTQFPIPDTEMDTERGVFVLDDLSMYTVQQGGQNTAEDTYFLDDNGVLSVLINQGARLPSIRFLGAYGLDGDTGIYFFTDRFTTPTSNRIGLFWGTVIDAAVPVVEGDWHVFSQNVIFATSAALDPDNVGRSFAGTLSIDDQGMITGDALESTSAALSLTGTAQAFADSRVDLTLDVEDPQMVTDQRVYLAGTASNVILGIDEDETDGESGLLALMALRTTPKDESMLAGTYLLGLHTVFISVSQPGTDVAVGTLVFNSTGGWTLDALGADFQDFSYTGTYAMEDDGTLMFTVSGTNESWLGAVDEDYQTVLFVDNFVEQRTSGKPPELNLGLAVREVDTSTP